MTLCFRLSHMTRVRSPEKPLIRNRTNMFFSMIVTCFSLCLMISAYLLFYSPYRIRNSNGFILLFLTFTIHSLFIGILPFCQFYLLYFLVFIDVDSFDGLFHTICVFYCVIESLFYLFTVEEARLLNVRSLPQRLSLPENYDEQFVDRILKVYETSHEDFRVCFAGWFNGVEKSTWNLIYEDNILEYIAMATYGVKCWNEMTDEQQKRITHLFHEGYLKKYPEQRVKIKEGYNDQIQLKHPYRDLIAYTHYPWIKYLLFAFVRSIMVWVLKSIGYEYLIIDDISFYIRKYPKKTSSPPILFLHGLSLCTNTYLLFIRRLTALNRTIILLDVPYASMRLYTEVFSMSAILSSIEKLLISLNVKHLTTISHSYGSLIQSCIIKQLTRFVSDQVVIFIDPVCFLLFDARYMNNFIYRQPRTPNQLLLHTSCTEDLYSIYAIERHLCWYECNLWVEDIQESHVRVHVFFSENDDIIPVAFVDEYLRRSNIDTTIFPQFKHGQFLISPKATEDVLEVVHQLETKSIGDIDLATIASNKDAQSIF